MRAFVERAFAHVGRENVWKGKGLDEVGIDARTGAVLISVDPRYFRPTVVDERLGDATKAREKLGWRPKNNLSQSVEKLLVLGSSCICPKHARQPNPESALLTSALEPTNEWYAVAKIAGLKLCQAYRRQFGADFISAMPTNLYGPGDNWDLQTSHVVAALIRKAHEAKVAGADELVVTPPQMTKATLPRVATIRSRRMSSSRKSPAQVPLRSRRRCGKKRRKYSNARSTSPPPPVIPDAPQHAMLRC